MSTSSPLAAYKDLCIDAVDPARLGRFWGDVLGLELHLQDDGDAYLTGATPQHAIWVNRVPEPKTAKHRMHLDVNASSVEEVAAHGATVTDDSHPWTIMSDPEDGEFCVFVRDGAIGQRLYEIVVAAPDDPAACAAIATWWAQVLAARAAHDEPRGFSWVEHIPGAPLEAISFVPVPEPKTVKNRIHIDITTPDLDALLAAGATIVRPRDDEIRWHILADPHGNEFCAFVEG